MRKTPAGKPRVGIRIGIAAMELGRPGPAGIEAIRRAEARGLIKRLRRTRGGKRIVDAETLEELRALLPLVGQMVVE